MVFRPTTWDLIQLSYLVLVTVVHRTTLIF